MTVQSNPRWKDFPECLSGKKRCLEFQVRYSALSLCMPLCGEKIDKQLVLTGQSCYGWPSGMRLSALAWGMGLGMWESAQWKLTGFKGIYSWMLKKFLVFMNIEPFQIIFWKLEKYRLFPRHDWVARAVCHSGGDGWPFTHYCSSRYSSPPAGWEDCTRSAHTPRPG